MLSMTMLAPFSDEDVLKIREAIEYLLPAVECIVSEGYDMAMNKYNPKKEKKAKKAKKEKQAACDGNGQAGTGSEGGEGENG